MEKDNSSKSRRFELRNIFGYLTFFAFLLFLTLFYFTNIPNGLSSAEMTSATISGNLTLVNWLEQIVNLPYHALQWLSINFFDLSVLAIRLPSIIIAVLCGTLILSIIRQLNKPNIAIIAGLIVISTALFITMARTGAPMIMPIFWCLLAISATIHAISKPKHNLRWLVVAGTALALNVYSVFGIFLTVICAVVALFHPKVRLHLFKTKPWKIIVTILIWLLLISPLVWGVINDPSIVQQLLGVSLSSLSWDTIVNNLTSVFWFTGNPSNGFVIPLIVMAELGIAGIGLYNFIRHFHSARSYLALPLFIVVLILALLNIEAGPLLLVPMVLLIASGTSFLVEAWFSLFPRNPYARFIGAASLTALIGWIILMGCFRYFESNFYDKDLPYAFHSEIYVVNEILEKNSDKTISIISTNENELGFYSLLEKNNPNLNVTNKLNRADITILFSSAFDQQGTNKSPTRIITNNLRNNSEILRIYQK